jgi:ATP-dependent Lhr-like helicase
LTRESAMPRWRELLPVLRRLEARGDIRGGRFVSGFGGEQFALPQAADSLRASRHRESQEEIAVAAADPMNLAGVVVPGERVAAVPGKAVRYCNGSLVVEDPHDPGEANIAATPPFAKRRRLAAPVLPANLPDPAPPAATLF